ncbi:hypothetical protein P280DRAFT_139028 [Massarina eburnea CBS 473.64]|uniref:Uncharacterized protein n=1 Tax=Massarina eburnea CBS 473.64 TaxID=1395130 RepID=A0A6A6RSV1_9PLEO|nr:hypothetical protein P280DRAFT_139028 [Massarina eburnea CBS 473.64]
MQGNHDLRIQPTSFTLSLLSIIRRAFGQTNRLLPFVMGSNTHGLLFASDLSQWVFSCQYFKEDGWEFDGDYGGVLSYVSFPSSSTWYGWNEAKSIHSAMNFTYVSRSSSEFLSTLVCESSYDSRNPRLVTVTSSFLTDEPFTTTTVLSTGAMNAYGIFVKYKSGGLGGSKTEASSGNSNSGGSSSSTDAPTSSNTAVSPDGKGRLSTGASIGIGISIGVVFFALVIGTVFFVLRRRKNAKMLPVSSQHLESSQDGRQNLAGLAGKRHYSNQLDELQPQVK